MSTETINSHSSNLKSSFPILPPLNHKSQSKILIPIVCNDNNSDLIDLICGDLILDPLKTNLYKPRKTKLLPPIIRPEKIDEIIKPDINQSSKKSLENASISEIQEKEILITELSSSDMFWYENTLIKKINSLRKQFDLSELYENIILKKIVSEYLTTNSTNEFEVDFSLLNKISQNCRWNDGFEVVFIEFQPINDKIYSLDDFEENLRKTFIVLTESESDLKKMVIPELNSIAISCQVTRSRIIILVLLSKVSVHINTIQKISDDLCIIQGKLFNCDYGPFLLKIMNDCSNEDITNDQNRIALITPKNMTFNVLSGEFSIDVNITGIFDFPFKRAELYIKSDPIGIRYQANSLMKTVPKNLKPALNFTIQVYPLENTSLIKLRAENIDIKNADFPKEFVQSLNKEINFGENKKENSINSFESYENNESKEDELKDEQNDIKNRESVNNSQVPRVSSESNGKFRSSQGRNQEILKNTDIINLITNGKKGSVEIDEDSLKFELETALEEIKTEFARQIKYSKTLQYKIALISRNGRKKQLILMSNFTESNVNQMKYHRLLQEIKQLFANKKLLKEKYNLEKEKVKIKLEAKKVSCSQILESFMNVKNQTLFNANFSTISTLKPEKVISSFTSKEKAISLKLRSLTVEVLEKKALLEKMKKVLKLNQSNKSIPMIDFEKVKVENQSIHEKIGSRNYEIGTIIQKNKHILHIITHIKERLNMEEPINNQFKKNLEQTSLIKSFSL